MSIVRFLRSRLAGEVGEIADTEPRDAHLTEVGERFTFLRALEDRGAASLWMYTLTLFQNFAE